jgi:hypothetical protein
MVIFNIGSNYSREYLVITIKYPYLEGSEFDLWSDLFVDFSAHRLKSSHLSKV